MIISNRQRKDRALFLPAEWPTVSETSFFSLFPPVKSFMEGKSLYDFPLFCGSYQYIMKDDRIQSNFYRKKGGMGTNCPVLLEYENQEAG
jgi:hypothetical protein